MVKSKIAYSYFFWVAFSVVITVALFIRLGFLDGLLTSFILSAFLYITIAKFSCSSVQIQNQQIEVSYLFPLLFLKRKILIRQNTVLEFELGYFYYFEDEHSLAPIQFLNPHDRIFFYEVVGQKKILYDSLRVNVSYSEFKRIRNLLAEIVTN